MNKIQYDIIYHVCVHLPKHHIFAAIFLILVQKHFIIIDLKLGKHSKLDLSREKQFFC